MAVNAEIRKLSPDPIVSLYILDTTPIGGGEIYRFTGMPKTSGVVTFNALPYQPVDMEATGFKWDGRGAFPRPKIKMMNFGGLISSAIIAFGDIVGSKFYRIRTFEKHLDGGSDPDPDAIFPMEIYTVNQRTAQNKIFVEWQLTSVLDQLGAQLPRRQVLRDSCTHTYRSWNGSAFDYTNVSCPYTGGNKFDENGDATNNAGDDCGRRITDCKLRFGENGILPTRAFPGVARTQN